MKSGQQFSLERLWSSARSMGVWEWCRSLYIAFNAIAAVALAFYALWIHWDGPQGDQARFALIFLVLALAGVCLIAVQVVADEKWDWPSWITVMFVVLGIGVSFSLANWTDLRGDDSNSTAIRNMALVLGGAIAGIFALWRSIVSERQADTAQQSLLNERYQKGAEMLGSEALSVRLGGIYALERLATEYPELYHIQVMKLFCAFARNPTKDGDQDIPPAREDVRAVMDAIRDRKKFGVQLERKNDIELNLSSAYLRRLNLKKANLTGANLTDANLTELNLKKANLTGANLTDANLSGASLAGADLSCASLLSTNLSGAFFVQKPDDEQDRGETIVVKGLTQESLDWACADPSNPPNLGHAFDAKTGMPLVWRDKPCEDD